MCRLRDKRAQTVPAALRAVEQFGQKRFRRFEQMPSRGGPAHAQQRHLSRSIARPSTPARRDTLLGRWTAQQHEAVLAGVAGDGTELIQDRNACIHTGGAKNLKRNDFLAN